MQFYNDIDPELKSFINHYWVMSGDLDHTKLYEILPMDHIDIVMVIKGHISFFTEDEEIIPSSIFFQGIKTKPMFLRQQKYTKTIGISFHPWGLPSLLNQPLNHFQNQIVNIEDVNLSLFEALNIFRNNQNNNCEVNINSLERILKKHLYISPHYENGLLHIKKFIFSNSSVDQYIQENNISRKTLERLFNRYVGISPHKFRQITQFEYISRELIHSDHIDLSSLTLEGDYYDQSHLNKHFKKYSEKSPKKFMEKNSSLKSKIKFK